MVSVTCEVTAIDNNALYCQDAVAASSGIMVYDSSGVLDGYDEGDCITIEATVYEYYGITELVDVNSITTLMNML